jgi:hypothetical protein
MSMGPGKTNVGNRAPVARPSDNTPSAVKQQPREISALVSWAIEHGMAPDSPTTVDAVIKWASSQGFRGRDMNDVVSWARGKGYKESSYEQTVRSYQGVATGIRADGANRTAMADEGSIDGAPLDGVRQLRRVSPIQVLASNVQAISGMLTSNDPQAQADALAQLQGVYAVTTSATPPAPAAVAALGSTIAGDLNGVIGNRSITDTWGTLVTNFRRVDIEQLVQQVLRESYVDVLKDLAEQAARAKFYNDMKAGIRSELEAARTALATAKTDEELGEYTAVAFETTPQFDEKGNMVPAAPVPQEEKITTRVELQAYIENLDSQLKTVGEDAQLASVDLQNTLQKQSQLLQLLSNISKLLHTTAMGIIQKIA